MTMQKTRILMRDFEAHDQRREDSTVREIEMAVDALAHEFCIQFFRDLAIYGLKEAKMYLLDYVQGKYGDTRHAQETRFHEVVDSVLKRIGRQE